MTLDVDELDILDIQVGQKAEITADAISDRTFEGVVTSISSAGTTSGGTTTYPVTIRIDDTGSLMPGMNATAALDIPPCQRYVIVKATAGFAVFRLISKSLLFYSCLDFTQNLGKTHFCLTFGVQIKFGLFFVARFATLDQLIRFLIRLFDGFHHRSFGSFHAFESLDKPSHLAIRPCLTQRRLLFLHCCIY